MSGLLSRAAPSAKGVDPGGVLDFLDAVQAAAIELHGFSLFRAGAVVVEGYWHPYAAERPHMQHSATKSWTATAVGLALGHDRLRLDDAVATFFPEHLPAEPSANLMAMTVRDLLTMRTGHASGLSGGEWRGRRESWVRAFLHEPVPQAPGETFIYSSGSSYMLSAIVSSVMGETIHALLDREVFQPLAMRSIQWDVSPEGYNTGGNGLSCVMEDTLKFGALHLAEGRWQGRAILPDAWVREATMPHVVQARLGVMDGRRYAAPVASDDATRLGYGYHWWMTPFGGYRASGIFGQHCIVLPGHDAVIAFTGAVRSGDPRLLALTWEHLVPALDRGLSAREGELATRLASLAMPQQKGESHGLAGRHHYDVDANEAGVTALGFDFGSGTCTFTLVDARGTHRITAGLGHRVEGVTTMTGNALHHEYQPDVLRVLSEAVWLTPHRLCMTWRFVETAFCDTVICDFESERVTMQRRVNVNAGPTELPPITGTAAN